MSSPKVRLTVTVDPDLVDVGNSAVADGLAESMSAWVNTALAERVVKERRLAALAAAVAAFEAEFGVITEEEIAAQARLDRSTADVVRGPQRRSSARKIASR